MKIERVEIYPLVARLDELFGWSIRVCLDVPQ